MEPLMRNTERTQDREEVSTIQQRIAEMAEHHPREPLVSLNQRLTAAVFREAYRKLKRKTEPGADRVTVTQYGENLEEKLVELREQAMSGRYKAPPVKRVEIPKGAGSKETRPIGIPTVEDRILQRAVKTILEPIFERSFYDFSYGFRPKRSAHQALEHLRNQIHDLRTQVILDLDISKFFDTIDHGKLRDMFSLRVNDGTICRLIGKWLKAGVLHEEQVYYPELGTPQGGVISPLLANIYLHVVVDHWFEKRRRTLKGTAFMVRYADDIVMGFGNVREAEQIQQELKERLAAYGLTMHPEKTRLLNFARPQLYSEGNGPDTFDFLGFTHYWAKSRKGNWAVKRKTASKRLTRALKDITEWCRKNMHEPMREQFMTLKQKMLGHNQYYGITCNGLSLKKFRKGVTLIWRKWLARRGGKRCVPWPYYWQLLREVFVFPAPRPVRSVCLAKP